jgi:hypothetical protein
MVVAARQRAARVGEHNAVVGKLLSGSLAS